jgi:hypothetical protein
MRIRRFRVQCPARSTLPAISAVVCKSTPTCMYGIMLMQEQEPARQATIDCHLRGPPYHSEFIGS